jgi:catechol 2,3-dioxygenase-like lactoylglutathione lyase family enzyme
MLDLVHMPRLSQIGIYVKDTEKAIERYEKVFGIGPWLVLEGETERCVDRGCEVTMKGRISMGYSGRIQLEERLQACRDAGIEVLVRGTLKKLGMTIDYAYLDTVDQVGVILEFIQTRFMGMKARQFPPLLNLLARIQKRTGFPR